MEAADLSAITAGTLNKEELFGVRTVLRTRRVPRASTGSGSRVLVYSVL